MTYASVKSRTNEGLFLSVFYSREMWDKLLIEFIQPLLKKYVKEIFDVIIIFSVDQGENMRISIYGNEIQKIKTDINDKLPYFLQDNLSRRLVYDREDLFEDFPNNSYYFDLFLPELFDQNDKIENLKLSVRTLISKDIIYQLSKEAIDEESIFTFILYLHLAVFYAILKDKKYMLNDMKEICNDVPRMFSITHQVNLDYQATGIYLANREELKGVINMLYQKKDSYSEFQWLKAFSNKLDHLLPDENNLLHFGGLISEIINLQLGVNDKKILALASILNYKLLLDRKLEG